MIIQLRKKLLSDYSELKFVEETHSYYVNNKKFPSVSSLIKRYYRKFDEVKHSIRIAERENTTPEKIIEGWREINEFACEKGHNVHDFGEALTKGVSAESKYIQSLGLVKFINSLPKHIIPVTEELRMFSIKYGYAGTCDLICYNTKTQSIELYDYKTNKDLFKNHRGQKMFIPFDTYLDCPLSHYILQLSYYQILLEEKQNLVSKRVVVYLVKDDFYLYDLPDVTKQLRHEITKPIGIL